MASDEARQPLIPQPLDLNPGAATTRRGAGPRRKTFRRCRSAPMTPDPIFSEQNVVSNPTPLLNNPFFNNITGLNFYKVLIPLSFYLGIATICFYVVRDQLNGTKTDGVLDAVYFCIVTMTTVGYGDLVPRTNGAKLLACAFVFSGMAIVCLTLSKAADYLVEKQEVLLVKALHLRKKVSYVDLLKEAEMNRTKYKCVVTSIVLVSLMAAGTIFLTTVEKLEFVDAFYCVCSTITTLGYGDKSFSTKWGRVFAVFWILIGTITLAQLFLYIAELNTENRQRKLVNWVLTRKMTNYDLEAADLDDDGNVGAAEFVLYKLKEMGKITQDDISIILEEFEDLDVDQSGTLSPSDIFLAQSVQTVHR